MTVSGIYKIQSILFPNKVYIGSAIDFRKRKIVHLCYLRKNKHPNKKLQNHFNKYKESDLVFSLVVGINKPNLIVAEQYFIDSMSPWFNLCKIAGSNIGLKYSEETKIKMRINRIGKKPTLGKTWKVSNEVKEHNRQIHL